MMKIRNIFIVLVLILTGCSSTYTLKDFSSKEKFYENFNKYMSNKPVKVTFVNDSSFVISKNVKISNDSILLLSSGQNAFNNFPLDKVKEIRNIHIHNNRLNGLWMGSSFCFLLSIPIIEAVREGSNDPTKLPTFPASFGFAGLGGLIGLGIGSIVDKTYIYKFNP